MKKYSLVVLLLITSKFLVAQTIPNSGFENWTNYGQFSALNGWISNPSITKSSNAYTGNNCVKLETVVFGGFGGGGGGVDTIPGNMNTGRQGQGPGTGKSGYALTLRPDSLIGYADYTPFLSDSFVVQVQITKWNSSTRKRDILGKSTYKGGSTGGAYKRFSFKIEYTSPFTPDSANITVLSTDSDPAHPLMGSILYIDALSYFRFVSTTTGITFAAVQEENALFPNPATSTIQLCNFEKGELIITNQLGQTVKSIVVNSEKVEIIDVSDLNEGIYYLITGKGAVQKLLIQK